MADVESSRPVFFREDVAVMIFTGTGIITSLLIGLQLDGHVDTSWCVYKYLIFFKKIHHNIKSESDCMRVCASACECVRTPVNALGPSPSS